MRISSLFSISYLGMFLIIENLLFGLELILYLKSSLFVDKYVVIQSQSL
jgi:hypothetical protein